MNIDYVWKGKKIELRVPYKVMYGKMQSRHSFYQIQKAYAWREVNFLKFPQNVQPF